MKYLDSMTYIKNSVVSFSLLNIWVLDPPGQIVDHHELQEGGVDEAHAHSVPQVHCSQIGNNRKVGAKAVE